MAAHLKYDWELGKALYSRGLGPTAIAEKLGCSVHTVYQKVKHQHWTALRKQDQDLIAEDTHGWIEIASKQWVKEVDTLLRRITEYARSLKQPKGWSEYRSAVDSLRGLISSGREHYGLDKVGDLISLGVRMSKGTVEIALVAQSAGSQQQESASLSVSCMPKPIEGESSGEVIEASVIDNEGKETNGGDAGQGDDGGSLSSPTPISIAVPENIPPNPDMFTTDSIGNNPDITDLSTNT